MQQQASILCDLQSCETAVRTCPQCNKTWEDDCEDGGIIGRCDCGDVSVEAGNEAGAGQWAMAIHKYMMTLYMYII